MWAGRSVGNGARIGRRADRRLHHQPRERVLAERAAVALVGAHGRLVDDEDRVVGVELLAQPRARRDVADEHPRPPDDLDVALAHARVARRDLARGLGAVEVRAAEPEPDRALLVAAAHPQHAVAAHRRHLDLRARARLLADPDLGRLVVRLELVELDKR